MELLEQQPEAFEILLDSGLGCAGCGMAQHETIEQGCLAHGFAQESIKELVKELNEELKSGK